MSTDVTDEYRNIEPKWCAIHNGWFYRCVALTDNIDEWNECLKAHDEKVIQSILAYLKAENLEVKSRKYSAMPRPMAMGDWDNWGDWGGWN
jgi:hypothetical protein